MLIQDKCSEVTVLLALRIRTNQQVLQQICRAKCKCKCLSRIETQVTLKKALSCRRSFIVKFAHHSNSAQISLKAYESVILLSLVERRYCILHHTRWFLQSPSENRLKSKCNLQVRYSVKLNKVIYLVAAILDISPVHNGY